MIKSAEKDLERAIDSFVISIISSFIFKIIRLHGMVIIIIELKSTLYSYDIAKFREEKISISRSLSGVS